MLDLAEKGLEFSKLITPEVSIILETLQEHDKDTFIIGGAVRDFLFVHQVGDFDIATEAVPTEIMEWMNGGELEGLIENAINIKKKAIRKQAKEGGVLADRLEQVIRESEDEIFQEAFKEMILPEILAKVTEVYQNHSLFLIH